jgi:hypothetical protein
MQLYSKTNECIKNYEKRYLVSYWEMKAEWGIETISRCNINGKNEMERSGLEIWKMKRVKRKIFAITFLHTILKRINTKRREKNL